MGNQIRAEWYRIRQRWSFPAFVILMAALPALVALTALAERMDAASFCLGISQVLWVGMFLAVSCADMAFSGQHRYGTLKNEAVFGISRARMYLARLAAAVLLGLFLTAVGFASAFLSALVLLGDPAWTAASFAALLPRVLGAVPLWISAAALTLCPEFLLRSEGTAVIFSFLYLTFGWLSLGLFYLAEEPSHSFLDAVLAFLFSCHPLTPFFPDVLSVDGVSISVSGLDGSWGAVGRSWLIGLGWTALTAAVCVPALGRRELR